MVRFQRTVPIHPSPGNSFHRMRSPMSARDASLVISLAVIGLCAACATTPRGPQAVEWFQSGFYGGARIGVADLSTSAGDLDDDLQSLGHTTSTDLDEGDAAWGLYGGWRFERPFSVELGFTNLGRVESTIATNSMNIPAFLDDVAKKHPFLGAGVELTGNYWILDRKRLEIGIGGGLWYWDADVEAKAATGQKTEIDETGLDPLVGLDVVFRLTERLDLRGAYDHYWLEDNGAHALWFGVQGRIF